MRLKLTLIKKHSSQILVFMLFWSCSPDQKEISAINEVNRPTNSTVTANGTKIDLKDSSMLHDDLEMEGDLNCEQHFLAALHQTKPTDVDIIHCDYWDAEHPNWLECVYSFEVAINDTFFLDLIEHNQMIPLLDEDEFIRQQDDWFLPVNVKRYEGYYTEDDFDDFQIFRDRITGHIFIRGSES